MKRAPLETLHLEANPSEGPPCEGTSCKTCGKRLRVPVNEKLPGNNHWFSARHWKPMSDERSCCSASHLHIFGRCQSAFERLGWKCDLEYVAFLRNLLSAVLRRDSSLSPSTVCFSLLCFALIPFPSHKSTFASFLLRHKCAFFGSLTWNTQTQWTSSSVGGIYYILVDLRLALFFLFVQQCCSRTNRSRSWWK